MEDMMSRISEILDDPVQAEKIKNLASSLMSSSASDPQSSPSASASQGETDMHMSAPSMSQMASRSVPQMYPTSSESLSGLTELASSFAGLISKSGIMRSMPSSESINRNINLLNAIRPYMRAERADRLSNAVKAMQVISTIAKLK